MYRRAVKVPHAWTRGQPWAQPWYAYQTEVWGNGWVAVNPSSQDTKVSSCSQMSILSWNIDFRRPWPSERMVIMLQEMLVSDLELIQTQPWVRQGYHMTDLSHEFWESSHYGTCMLVSKDLSISQLFRVHYTDTAMQRDALFVDLRLALGITRVCCTHLESLVADPPKRPAQLTEAANFMHMADASVLGGDLNAIQPFDKDLHRLNILEDSYLETDGIEDSPSGYTWGQMAPTQERQMFGLSRMDKLLYCGKIRVDRFETFGMDVLVDDESVRHDLVTRHDLEKGWVTDHLGLRGDFEVTEVESKAAL